jgi:molybdopterin adenylyltransferase
MVRRTPTSHVPSAVCPVGVMPRMVSPAPPYCGGVRTAIITVSNGVAAGVAEDESGARLAAAASEAGAEVVAVEAVPDDKNVIEERLAHHADGGCTFVFTTGGTGFTPDDVTPEATKAVLDRDAPGFAEAMRAEAIRHTPMGILTRGISGIRGRTLIVNFPGNPKAIDELFPVLAPTLGHVAATLRSEGGSRGAHGAG